MTQRICAVLLLALVSRDAAAMDWSRPWVEPQDSRQAASNSDEYAWRLFVASNWPADPKAAFGTAGPVAWEVWKNASDVYLDDGGDPGPWEARGATAAADERRFETFSLKDIPVVRHIVHGKMVPLTDPVANAKRLTEIRMNRATFEYIRSNELYNSDGQMRLIASGRRLSFPSSAIEVKAKWRPIRDDERTRYHTVMIHLGDGTERLYGLTALHIVSKALPQWFWATFEHADNPTLPGADGWQLPSRDRFACAGERDDCNRAPRGIGLEGTVWQNYRLRGTLTRFVDDSSRPLLLANSELEAGMQQSSSCMTCHARSSLAVVGGTPVRLPIFEASPSLERRGSVGAPRAEWFEDPLDSRKQLFESLDFVWSLSKARPRKVPHET